MFLSDCTTVEFNRRYERELNQRKITQPITLGHIRASYKQLPEHQRAHIRNKSYNEVSPGRFWGKNNQKIGTPTRHNTNLRTLLGGVGNENPNLNNNLPLPNSYRQGLINTHRRKVKTGHIKPNRSIVTPRIRQSVGDRIKTSRYNTWLSNESVQQRHRPPGRSAWDIVPDPWAGTPTPTISPSNFAPKQQLALPPARNTNNTISSTQGLRQPASAQTMGNMRRSTRSTVNPSTPVRQAGVNKFLVGGVVAGAGLVGAGAYSLWRRNRNKDKK